MKIITENKVVPIAQVVPNTFNPKPDADSPESKKEIERIKKSLKANAQIVPLVVREVGKQYELIDGYHRLIAMREMKVKEVEVKNLGKLTKEQAIQISLSLERIGVDIDNLKEASLLNELLDQTPIEELVKTFPYSEEELKSKVELLNEDWEKSFEEALEEDTDKAPKFVIVFQSEDEKQEFLDLLNQRGSEETTPAKVLTDALRA